LPASDQYVAVGIALRVGVGVDVKDPVKDGVDVTVAVGVREFVRVGVDVHEDDGVTENKAVFVTVVVEVVETDAEADDDGES